MAIKLLASVIGTVIGLYIAAAAVFGDLNIKRGICKWIDELVKSSMDDQ